MAQTAPQKRYGLFSLAILLFLLAGAALFLGSHNFAIRSVGLVGCIVGVYLVRASNVHAPRASAVAAGEGPDSREKKRPGPLMWTVGVALLLLAGASFFYLYQDALHGYQEALPVYVFAGVGLACALVWSYLVSKVL